MQQFACCIFLNTSKALGTLEFEINEDWLHDLHTGLFNSQYYIQKISVSAKKGGPWGNFTAIKCISDYLRRPIYVWSTDSAKIIVKGDSGNPNLCVRSLFRRNREFMKTNIRHYWSHLVVIWWNPIIWQKIVMFFKFYFICKFLLLTEPLVWYISSFHHSYRIGRQDGNLMTLNKWTHKQMATKRMKRRQPDDPGLVKNAEAPSPHRHTVRPGSEILASVLWFQE